MRNSPFVTEALPSLRYIGILNKPQGQIFDKPLHHHPEHLELMLISGGTARIKINNRWYEAGPHDLIIYNPSLWHEEHLEIGGQHHILYLGVNGFQLPALGSSWLTDNAELYVLPLQEQYAKLETRFFEIHMEKKTLAAHSQWLCNCLTGALLIEIMALLSPDGKANGKKQRSWDLGLVTQYIHEHYYEPINLTDLSKLAFLSPFHFSRLFKADTGMSPMHYLISYRMEAAAYFLLSTSESIAAIAERVGYKSETHFQNLFKKRMGKTPGQFRKDGK